MNQGKAQEYEYRVVAALDGGNIRTYLPYGTRSYPQLSTARGLASRERRYSSHWVWIERRPVATEWEVVE